jgi:hypothetical protein
MTLGQAEAALALYRHNQRLPTWGKDTLTEAARMVSLDEEVVSGRKAGSLGDYQFEMDVMVAMKEALPEGSEQSALSDLLRQAARLDEDPGRLIEPEQLTKLMSWLEALRESVADERATLFERNVQWQP